MLKRLLATHQEGFTVYLRQGRRQNLNDKAVRNVLMYAVQKVNLEARDTILMVDSSTVDEVVTDALLTILNNPEKFGSYFDQMEAARKSYTEAEKRRKTLLAKAEKQKKNLITQMTLLDPTNPEDKDLLDSYKEKHTAISKEIRDLSTPLQSGTEAGDYYTLSQLLIRTRDSWESLSTHVQQELCRATICKVYLDPLSPRFYKVAIEWKVPAWGTTVLVIERPSAAQLTWTPEEDEILRERLEKNASVDETLQALPVRSPWVINRRIRTLGLSTKGPFNATKLRNEEYRTYCFEDMKVMEAYKQYGEGQVANSEFRGDRAEATGHITSIIWSVHLPTRP
ncbi:hypothetical protein KSD_04080 [Ktedonobacter sp. SOSP1-85]|nr:hypothetical protein KSD_04080 [Ktedonobacter sp. SOSP1-85]